VPAERMPMNDPREQAPDPEQLRRILQRHPAGQGGPPADVFCERRSSLSIDLIDGEVTRLAKVREEGAAARTAGPGGWRFEFTDGLGPEALDRLAGGGSRELAGARLTVLPPEPLEQLIASLRTVRAEAERLEPACRHFEVSFFASRQQVWILDAEGRLVTDRRSAMRVTARARIGAAMGSAHRGGAWSTGALDPVDARNLAGEAVKAARTALGATATNPGPRTVILAAGSGGILLHEACGHLLEADYVRRGLSPYAGRLGRTVASPMVTAVDDPTLPGLPATQHVDDEGTATRRKLLLHRGVLAGFLCGRLEAGEGGPGFTSGNARRRSFRHPPLPRMSNTMIVPGETPPAEIIGATRDGIFAARLAAGRADPVSGRFRFVVAEAALVENGRLTRPLAPLVISGVGPEALAAIDLVGNDGRVDPTAAGCTKAGQTIPVSVGHPTLRIETLTVEPLGRDGR